MPLCGKIDYETVIALQRHILFGGKFLRNRTRMYADYADVVESYANPCNPCNPHKSVFQQKSDAVMIGFAYFSHSLSCPAML